MLAIAKGKSTELHCKIKLLNFGIFSMWVNFPSIFTMYLMIIWNIAKEKVYY